MTAERARRQALRAQSEMGEQEASHPADAGRLGWRQVDGLDWRLDINRGAIVTTDYTGGIFALGGGLHNRRLWRGNIDVWRVGGVLAAARTGEGGDCISNAGCLQDERSIAYADEKKQDRFEMCAT